MNLKRYIYEEEPIPVMAIPIITAKVCLNCDTIYRGRECPTCTDRGEPLTKWLPSMRRNIND